MKKILIFSLAYLPTFTSGAEGAIKEITDRIDPKDFEFHMITLRFDASIPRHECIGNVYVHRVGWGNAPSPEAAASPLFYISKILFVPLAAFSAFSLHRKHRFDGMWAMMTYMLFPLVIARLAGLRVPYVLTLQDGDPYEKVFERLKIRPFVPLIDYGFKNASVIQCISHYLATWPEKRGSKSPIELIRNGANPKNLYPEYDPADVEKIKGKLGKEEGDFYLFNAARLVYQKAHDDVIKALSLLPENVHYVLVGGGQDEHMLKELVQKEGLEKRVHFIGKLERYEVPLYRNTQLADAFVSPSRSEGLGNSFLSAMAARLPVIATQEGGLAEFIFDEKRNPDKDTTAWAVDPGSPEQIAEAVREVIENPEKVKRVTETARKMVETDFNWDVIGAEMQSRVFERITK